MADWSQWTENSENPYLQWRRVTNRDAVGEDFFEEVGILFRQAAFGNFGLSLPPSVFGTGIDPRSVGPSPTVGFEAAISELNTPLPDAVLNDKGDKSVTGLPPESAVPTLDRQDSVIMGVIDVGIPLGHARLRNRDGSTRILAAWQQMGTTPTDYLPFGRELLQGEIDDLIKGCSGGDLKGWLDEETFNRATSVVDMENHYGEREAARVVAHGAHVMDLAAGCDPHEDPDFADKVKVIAVNMPSVDVLGNSGEFLSGSALSGVERIIALADAIWKNSFAPDPKTPAGPCPIPIIINMSFGKQAGAKNSVDLFPAYLNAIKDRREMQVLGPVFSAALKAAASAAKGKEIKACLAVLKDAAADYAASVSIPKKQAAARAAAKKDVDKKWSGVDQSKLKGLDAVLQKACEVAGPSIWPQSTLNFVMAAGNDNLERCNAILEPAKDQTQTLDWRILPDDQSPNFVEIWTSPPKGMPGILQDPASSITVSLVSPNGGQPSPHGPATANGVTFAGKTAAVFRQAKAFEAEDGNIVHLVRHVICVAPTHRATQDQDTAQAGLWQIRMQNNSAETVQCVLSIQSDQGLLPGSARSRRSYFDDESYIAYDAYDGMGNALESYSYGPEQFKNYDLKPHPTKGKISPVKRHGTMNATAAHKQVARIGGYRGTDGRPVYYSSTGRGTAPASDSEAKLTRPAKDDGAVVITELADDARAPTAALPSDDGVMHFGVLGAGGANGSVVAMRGTSCAAPQAARLIASELINDDFPKRFVLQSSRNRLVHRARLREENPDKLATIRDGKKDFLVDKRPSELIEVLGRGRIESQVKRRLDRFGNS